MTCQYENKIYEIISKMRDGERLTRDEIRDALLGYAEGSIPDYQMSALLMAVYIRGLDNVELADFIETMIASGGRISLDEVPGKKIDKHSTGGVGDKTSLVLAPLVAACGVNVPMVSGRGLGHTGGTLDKLESIPGMNVSITEQRLVEVLCDAGMVICGQTRNIAPVDGALYALRDATATVGSVPLIVSSIMSKKLAVGTDAIVLDVKTGEGAFMREARDAIELCRALVEAGRRAGRATTGLITEMNQPLGRAVGNSIEVIEAIEALKGNGPDDLMEVVFPLGACMLEAAGAVKSREQAFERLKRALDSMEALDRFERFICAQGGDPGVCRDYSLFPASDIREPVKAREAGYVSRIDAHRVGMAAVEVGAGRAAKESLIDHAAGFSFVKKIGDAVEVGETVLTIHANDEARLEKAKMRLEGAVEVSPDRPSRMKMIRFHVDPDGVHDWE